MKKNSKYLKNVLEITFLTLILAIVLIFIFGPYIYSFLSSIISGNPVTLDKIYLIQEDWMLQHVPFYSEFFQLLKSGEVGWSWNQFLGINFYASKAYYLIGDPFAYLGFLLSNKISFIPNVIFITSLLKFFVAGYTFDFYLSKLSIPRRYRIFFAAFYAFGGWTGVFIEHPVFISFYCLAPLLLAGCEDALQKNRYLLVMLSSCLLLMMNYYFTWMLCLFILPYWICRYIILSTNFDIRTFIIDSLKMLGAFIVGVLISSIIWLPSILHLLANPRLTAPDMVVYNSFDTRDLLMIIKSFFVPVLKYADKVYQNEWYAFYQIGIYATLVPLILIPQLFTNKSVSKKEKICYGVLLGLFILSLSNPQIGKIFHFTYSLRYSMLVSILLLILAAFSISKLKKINVLNLIITSFVLFAILYYVGITFANNMGVKQSIEIDIVKVALVLLFVYSSVLFMTKFSKYFYVVLLILGVGELGYMSNLAFDSQYGMPVSYLVHEQEIDEIFDALKELDDTKYRVIVDGMAFNVGAYFNQQVASTYDSVYQYSQRDFLDYIREYPDASWNLKIRDYNLFDIANIKYLIAFEPSLEDVEYYEYIGNQIDYESDYFKIYQVNDQSKFGRILNKFIKKSEIEELANENEYYLHELTIPINNTIVVDDEDYQYYLDNYSEVNQQIVEPSVFENNLIKMEVYCEKPAILMLSMPFDKGWKIVLNDKEVNAINVSGGFMAIALNEGNNKIVMEFSPSGLRLAKIMSLIGLLIMIFYILITRFKRQ